MSISKRDLRNVKWQIHAARVEELTKALDVGDQQKLDQLNTGPTKREQMNQARLAARQSSKERKALAAATKRMAAQQQRQQPPPVRQFNLAEDSLVILTRDTIGFRLGTTVNPYAAVSLQKGTVGVLVARDVSNVHNPWGLGRQLCHVMLPAGIVEIPAFMLRDCGDDAAEG